MMYHSSTRVIISAIVLLFSLSVSQRSTGQPRVSDQATFYTFSIDRVETGYRVTATDVQTVKGEFKIPDVGKVAGYDEGHLLVKVTKADGALVYETSLPNPLNQRLESGGERGEILQTQVQQDKGSFNVRIPFNTKDHIVSVYSVEAGQRLALLTTDR